MRAVARPRWGAVAFEVLVLVAAVATYFAVRGKVDAREALALDNAARLVELERGLGIWVEAGLQQLVVHSPSLLAVLNWIYIWGHWPVIVAVLLWLVLVHPAQYRVFRTAMLVSGAGGVLVFMVYPLAPPRLAGLGLVDTVSEYSQAYRVLQPPGFVAQYAAMPSLHVGWDLLMGIALVTTSTHLVLRVLGALLPVAMTTAVVLTANHYVLDAVAGAALVLVSLAVARRLSRPVPVAVVLPEQRRGTSGQGVAGDARGRSDSPDETAGDAARACRSGGR